MLLAVGMTFVIISGGLDLSVGSVVVFSSVASAQVMLHMANDWGTVEVGVVVALAAGMAWGIVNGFLIARLGLSSLIVTLGTLGAAQGLGEVISSDSDIGTVPTRSITPLAWGAFWSSLPRVDHDCRCRGRWTCARIYSLWLAHVHDRLKRGGSTPRRNRC